MSDVTLYEPGNIALEALTTAELREELASALSVSARHLIHMSAIWQELERRGEDLSALRSGIAVYLPMIARGELDARLVVRYAGRNMLLRHLAALPSSEQVKLIENDKIKMISLQGGNLVEEDVSLADIDVKNMAQIFGADGLISVADQRHAALRKTARTGRKLARVRFHDDGLSVGSAKASQAELRQAVSTIADGRGNIPDTAKARGSVMLDDSEYESLRSACAVADKPIGAMIRAALRACGLLDV